MSPEQTNPTRTHTTGQQTARDVWAHARTFCCRSTCMARRTICSFWAGLCTHSRGVTQRHTASVQNFQAHRVSCENSVSVVHAGMAHLWVSLHCRQAASNVLNQLDDPAQNQTVRKLQRPRRLLPSSHINVTRQARSQSGAKQSNRLRLCPQLHTGASGIKQGVRSYWRTDQQLPWSSQGNVHAGQPVKHDRCVAVGVGKHVLGSSKVLTLRLSDFRGQ